MSADAFKNGECVGKSKAIRSLVDVKQCVAKFWRSQNVVHLLMNALVRLSAPEKPTHAAHVVTDALLFAHQRFTEKQKHNIHRYHGLS